MDFFTFLHQRNLATYTPNGIEIANMNKQQMDFLKYIFFAREQLQKRVNLRRKKTLPGFWTSLILNFF